MRDSPQKMKGTEITPTEYNIQNRLEGNMNSFKQYTENDKGEKTQENTDALNAEQLATKIASSYHGKSNADMLRGILAEAEKSKRAGTLSNEEIDGFYQAFSPMLDSAQKKKLRAVVEKLKEIP